MAKTALITGVTGQDGAYLAQHLLRQGTTVHGLLRRSASADVIGERLRWLGILDDVHLIDGDLIDLSSCIRIMEKVKPDEVYNRPGRCQHAGGGAHRLPAGAVLPGVVV